MSGISENNAQERRLTEKLTVDREAKLRGLLRDFEDNLSAKGIILLYSGNSKGVDLFYNPQLISNIGLVHRMRLTESFYKLHYKKCIFTLS